MKQHFIALLLSSFINFAQAQDLCLDESYVFGSGGGVMLSEDFNNDGFLDLIRSGNYNGSYGFNLALGNSEGDFTLSHLTFNNSFPLYGIAAADFNDDNILDIVGTSSGENDVRLYLGIGDGSFQEPTSFTVEGNGYMSYGIAVADFNNDDNLDVAVNGNQNNKAAILLGDGTGNFSVPSYFIADEGVVYIDADDINNDGNADFITANRESDNISIFLGIGDGSFGEPITIVVGNQPEGLTINDINNDGLKDIIVANYSAEEKFSIIVNEGFGSFTESTNYNAPGAPSVVDVADFNNDGFKDIALAAFYGTQENLNGLIIVFGSESNNFQQSATFTTFGNAQSMILKDLNSDEKIDVATSTNIGVTLVYLNMECPLITMDYLIGTLKLYPNPASGQLNLDLPDGITLEKSVFYNMLGQKVLETSNNTSWNVSQLQTGVHFVTLITNEGTAQLRFIKE